MSIRSPSIEVCITVDLFDLIATVIASAAVTPFRSKYASENIAKIEIIEKLDIVLAAVLADFSIGYGALSPKALRLNFANLLLREKLFLKESTYTGKIMYEYKRKLIETTNRNMMNGKTEVSIPSYIT